MFKEELELVPTKPGSYQMYDKNDIVIYVGKAKNLKRRLSSYFNRTQTGKTAELVKNIAYFKYIVTNTELESFILEINLIKKYNPKYNILLKDDKSYPYIEYSRKPYPSLKVVRYLKVKNRKDKYLFGPYVNAYAARRIVNLINRLYPLKKCEGMPKDVCLYYHIHECLGYCKKDIDQEKIDEMEKDILSFLRGNEDIIKSKLKEKIEAYSEAMNYELALELKKELDYMTVVLEKQKVEIPYFDESNYFQHSENGEIILKKQDCNISSIDVERYTNCINWILLKDKKTMALLKRPFGDIYRQLTKEQYNIALYNNILLPQIAKQFQNKSAMYYIVKGNRLSNNLKHILTIDFKETNEELIHGEDILEEAGGDINELDIKTIISYINKYLQGIGAKTQDIDTIQK